jgi:NAD-dependent SIR2 family protein deacetylase
MDANDCLDCFRISCTQCKWVASDAEVILFLDGKLTKCPECGWAPGKTPLKDVTPTCLSADCPERTGGECSALLPNFPLEKVE